MSKLSVKHSKAVCLFSGGLDSTICLYYALAQNKEVIAMTVNYGQIHSKEVEIARSHAASLGVKHYPLHLDLPWGGSALLDASIPLASHRKESEMQDIPASYVPARNSILLSLATSCAEAEGAEEIFIGVNHLDSSGYPDCRPNFIYAFHKLITEGTKAGAENRSIVIQTPLIHKTKREIIKMGLELKVPFEKTWSCYRGLAKPCGTCDACILRAKGFEEAGVKDPALSL